MLSIKKNKSGRIFKLETANNLQFSKIQEIAKKYNLTINNHQGDFLTLNFFGESPKEKNITDFGSGLMVANVSEPSLYNKWSIVGVDANKLDELQPVFNELSKI